MCKFICAWGGGWEERKLRRKKDTLFCMGQIKLLPSIDPICCLLKQMSNNGKRKNITLSMSLQCSSKNM
jgi:hypothetical protein